MNIPYIYKKIREKLNDNGSKGVMTLPQMKEALSNVRITKSDTNKIMKDLQKHGIITLEVSKGRNQHTKIKVCSKGYATAYIIAFTSLLYTLALLLGTVMVVAI